VWKGRARPADLAEPGVAWILDRSGNGVGMWTWRGAVGRGDEETVTSKIAEYVYFWFWKGYMSRKMREECVEADLFC